MNRTILIMGGVGAVVVVVLIVVLMLRTPGTAGPSNGAATSTLGINDPAYVPYSSGSSQGSDASERSKEAVRAVLVAKIGSSNPDNIQPGETAIVGEYALQNWAGNITAGQALMQYDPTQGAWIFVVSTGGVWSAEELTQYHSVPADVAASLVVEAARR